MYKDNAAHNENSTINNITESSQAEGSRSSIAEDENAREKEIERKQTFEFDEESDNNVAPVGFRMNSLYHCLYKLESQNFVSCRKSIEAIIGPKQLEHVLGSKPVPTFSEYAYTTGCEKGLRKFVVKERCRIYENDLQEVERFNLMVIDVYDLMLNMVTFKDWNEEHLHEEDFGCYWKSVFDIMFRESNISLIRGEACCLATKYERQINEYKYGDVFTSIYGRKIDLIFKGPIVNDKDVKKTVELSSVETKPASVAEDAEAIQLNKNIRINKSILHNIVTQIGEYDDNCYVLGIDIIEDLSAFIYSVYQYEDVVVAVKAEEDNMFLPSDIDDLEDFVFGSTVDQLLNFKVNQYIQSIITKQFA
ncbi:hypothetical protein G6F46_009415 [Rhizopus delemar]|uniref:Uncharacterized protein n=2 Tax=Rhizopus TaxID=4842 RepID=A0A9P7CLG2_9FUNG|nr:hypothetical protein G6F55_008388 [Rhizopus delemar]KAG1545836.1 hypothetical protein G6F51_005233 [Rhizopus arrhizus]KAG1492984.1 hypothetical protein G6F54_008907 [Rhizopus delemar]KAG1507020.1 hypothetical protein G6F53_009258 [Rhizopus delemar]KAG1507972.1 hypothetical protein G6F52_011505 [Rhizopus delemar]